MGKPNKKTNPQRVQHAERKRRALELRMGGMPVLDIAQQLGVARETASRLLAEALEDTKEEIKENAEGLRAIELRRIEEYIRALRPAALAGDEAAHRALRGWHERLAKLTGLDRQPEPETQREMVIELRFPGERPETIEGQAEDMPGLPSGEDEPQA